jgi:CheY-like chemotaxis protein
MDGLSATQEIRRHERELGIAPATIVALTGASSVNAREQAIASGVDKFLTKPVPLSGLRPFIIDWKQQSTEDHRQRLVRNRGSASFHRIV